MPAAESSPRLRALVVDAAADYTDCLTHLLRLWGHEAAAVYSGTAALTVAANLRPDVVLLDPALPGPDGYEVARRLRRLPGLEAVVLVALTGCREAARRLLSQQDGFALYVVEPTDAEALRAVLGALAREKAKGRDEADDPVPIVRWHRGP